MPAVVRDFDRAALLVKGHRVAVQRLFSVHQLGKIPLVPLGEVQRRALAQPHQIHIPIVPRGETEQLAQARLIRQLKRVLPLDEVAALLAVGVARAEDVHGVVVLAI